MLVTLYLGFSHHLQGDHSGCSLGLVDIETWVAFEYEEHIQGDPGGRLRGLD